jgi:hypothetical protein
MAIHREIGVRMIKGYFSLKSFITNKMSVFDTILVYDPLKGVIGRYGWPSLSRINVL